jgi:surfactin synthase thioesterase subunit
MIRGTSAEFWVKFPQVEKPKFKLYYFPYSAGSAVSGAKFAKHLPPDTEVICFNAPSKQKNGKDLFPDFQSFLNAIFPAFLADLGDCEFALFGHSFGSLIVYLFLVELRKKGGGKMPKFVSISSKNAPTRHKENGNEKFFNTPFSTLKSEYLRLYSQNLPPRILKDDEMINMIVENFVTDMKVNTSFWFSLLSAEEQQPFDVPCIGNFLFTIICYVSFVLF